MIMLFLFAVGLGYRFILWPGSVGNCDRGSSEAIEEKDKPGLTPK